MGDNTEHITHQDLNKAFNRVKEKFNGFNAVKKSFREIRNKLHEIVRSFSNNVRVVIYVDDILDDPIILEAGNAENELLIAIDPEGEYTYSWPKKTWSKVFSDVWEGLKSFVGSILSCIASFIGGLLLKIGETLLPSIGFGEAKALHNK
ncbi:uncharacterized protein LOC134266878 [Saccostrea cucullata]|uniref:uncharacterized protein LOC134266878 n=1 Tax=Saccostrea cuccullata TaxID=36930 RepID=UPI002ED0BEA5